MAAGNWTLFNKAIKKMTSGNTTWSSGQTHPVNAVLRCKIYKVDVSASLAAASNYSLLSELGTSNAASFMSSYTLSGLTITAVNGSATHKFDMAADLVITASGGNATSLKYAVVYSSLSAGGGHLLMWCKLSDTQFSVASGNTLTIYTPTNGFFVMY